MPARLCAPRMRRVSCPRVAQVLRSARRRSRLVLLFMSCPSRGCPGACPLVAASRQLPSSYPAGSQRPKAFLLPDAQHFEVAPVYGSAVLAPSTLPPQQRVRAPAAPQRPLRARARGSTSGGTTRAGWRAWRTSRPRAMRAMCGGSSSACRCWSRWGGVHGVRCAFGCPS